MGSKESRRRYNGAIMEEEVEACGSIRIESSSQESIDSAFSSSGLTEDASSSSNGSLYDLSELMVQLPIKRGLSKFYEGKSQSFTSLASVESIEELVKKRCVNNHRKRMKSCKSYEGELDHKHSRAYSPKAIISKKGTMISYVLSSKENMKFVRCFSLQGKKL